MENLVRETFHSNFIWFILILIPEQSRIESRWYDCTDQTIDQTMQPTCDPFYSTCWSQCFNESAGCYCQLNEAVIMVLHIQHWQHKRMWRRSSKGPVFLSFSFSCLITTRSGWPYSPPSLQRSSAIKGRWSDRLHLSFGWWLCCQKRPHHGICCKHSGAEHWRYWRKWILLGRIFQ